MTKLILPLALLALLASCSKKPATDPSGLHDFELGTSAAATDSLAADTAAAATLPPLTSQGVGPVRLGMSPSRVPRALAGAYDSIAVETEMWDDEPYRVITFFLSGRKSMEAMAIADTARIDAISVLSPALPLNVNGTPVAVGTKASLLSRLKGVHPLPDSDGGMRRWEWHGVTIYADADTVAAINIGE